MREMVPRVRGRFVILGVVFSLFGAIFVRGDNAGVEKPVGIAAGTDVFDIQGTVTDAPDFAEFFDRLEAALEKVHPKSEEDFDSALSEVWKGIAKPGPAANVLVTLTGPSVTRETRTDAEGNFSFSGLSGGEYEISAEAPSRPTPKRNVRRTATAEAQITLGPYTGKVSLELSTIRPVIRGRITDPQGKPIPGAKVTAVLDVHHIAYEGYLENHDAPTWWAVSNADGFYELEGMDSMNWYHLAGALRGRKDLREFVEIHAEADGYVQSENPGEAPLLTEDVLILARRLLRIFNLWSQRIGGPQHPEKEGLAFPASRGNTITGIDIVLDPAGVDTEGDEERGSSSSTSTAVSADFVEIRIESHPQGWGYAHKTVRPVGSIIGAHQSGGPEAIRVYETKSEVTPEDMNTLKGLVSALQERSLPVVTRPDQQSQGYRSVIIVTGEDTEITAYAQGEEEFVPQEIQNIWDLVIKYKVGAW